MFKTKLKLIIKYCTLKNFDTSTDQGREQERYRIISLSIVTNLFCKLLSLISLVLTVSLTLPYLGPERFGIWMTIASFSAALTFLDLGIGNALTNRIAHSYASESYLQMVNKISGGLFLLFILSLSISSLLLLIVHYINWEYIIKGISANSVEELQSSIQNFAIIFGMGIFANGVQKIFMGMQKAYISYFVNSIFILLSIILLVFFSRIHASIPVLIIATIGVQYISGFLLLFLLFFKKLFSLDNIIAKARNEASYLLTNGFFFFVLQLGTLATWSGDNFIISTTLGVTYVSILSITQRLFQISTVPLTIYNTPLWAAYADAHARNDVAFIKKTLNSSLKIVGVFSFVLALFLILGGKKIILIWTGGKIDVPLSFIFAYGLWSIIDALSNTLASFLNGLNIVKQQMFAVLTLILFSIPIKYIVAKNFGLTSMLFTFIVLYLINYLFWYMYSFRKNIYSKLN